MQNRIPDELRREIAEASRYFERQFLALSLGISRHTIDLLRREAKFHGQNLSKIPLHEEDAATAEERLTSLRQRLIDAQMMQTIDGSPEWLLEIGRRVRAIGSSVSSGNGSISHD
jgi:hypothetical protein